jgi:hypothetical protein
MIPLFFFRIAQYNVDVHARTHTQPFVFEN